MRLGGPIVTGDISTPERWIAELQRRGYRAAYCPVESAEDPAVVAAYAAAASKAGIVIAEVGAWSNPIGTDEKERQAALLRCEQQLDLADRIGARCCVNIAGAPVAGKRVPHPDNLSKATFEMIVDVVRAIIDTVKPIRTFYALETHAWLYPYSAEHYLQLIRAIDRPRFAVHFDPVNLMSSPRRLYNNAAVIEDFVAKLGPHIKSSHVKDVTIRTELLVHIDEVRPGLGWLDVRTFLKEMSRLHPDTPLMLEHLGTEEEYAAAAAHVRSVAGELGLAV